MWAVGALGVCLACAWLAQATGLSGETAAVGRWLLLGLLASGALSVVLAIKERVLAHWDRKLTLSLGLLLLLSLTVRLIGADHEVGERAYQDEGTYYHHATEINQGKPWRWSFVYGHVSYYVGAFGLWLAGLFPGAFQTLASSWTGTSEALAHEWLVLRCLVALLSALTVVPVFAIAVNIVGWSSHDSAKHPSARAAGVAAGLLYSVSPLFNEGSHLIISDYPSACLATFCLAFVSRLLRTATPPQALLFFTLAGVSAGLAAATKYPAGVVAIAIIVASLWRAAVLRQEARPWLRSTLGLGIAGAAAIAGFLGSMPTFLRDPHYAIFSPRGMLFGARQYSGGGWIGVTPDSFFAYYADLTVEALGVIAALAVLIAPFILRGAVRRRYLAMATFPAVYIILLLTMNMVVARNLAPAVPGMAALAGVGLASLGGFVAARFARAGSGSLERYAVPALVAVALFQPAVATLQQTVGLARASTREVARTWMVANLPTGTRVFRESYTPRLPPEHFFLRRARFAARVPVEEIERDGYQYVLLAGNAFGRFLDEANHSQPHHAVYAERYRDMFDRYPEVAVFEPGRWRRGPTLWLLEVMPKSGPEERPDGASAGL